MTTPQHHDLTPHPDLGKGRSVSIIGAGICGLWQALLLAENGFAVTLYEQGSADMAHSCSWWGGGMLAPHCERESAEPLIETLGVEGLDVWSHYFPETTRQGSLVVAHHRDMPDLNRMARMTSSFETLDGTGIAALEPALAGRFNKGLYYAGEGHVAPRTLYPTFLERLRAMGVIIHFSTALQPQDAPGDHVIDCRGLWARDVFPTIRGVKGEMAIIESHDITINRPVRVVHPRFSIYIIPRYNGEYMIGATVIENDGGDGVSLRSTMELLSAAFALHPAFGEANVLQTGAHFRPALPNHLPRIARNGRVLAVNGLYRHGYLLAPAMALAVRDHLLERTTRKELFHAA